MLSLAFSCYVVFRKYLPLYRIGFSYSGLVTQPFQTVAEDIIIWSVGPKVLRESSFKTL